MTGPDQRRVRIGAPDEGTRSKPPPRREPEVVTPAPADAGAPSTPPAASRAAGQQRVIVPAPGAGGAAQPPKRTDPPRPAPQPPQRALQPARSAATGWRRFVPSRKVVLSVAAVLVLLVAGTLAWGYSKFRGIERVELSDVLASDNGTNYLIVGSDSRTGVDPNDPNSSAFLGDGNSPGGAERSDTILILRIDDEGARTLSVPRDLFVTISETGQQSRINSAFNGGPRRLIATLSNQLQLPIHHYLEVDFVSFASMVDALGGITIDFPHPAFDTHSGLNVVEAGPQTLDGTQALAYVRSRFYTERIDGAAVPQGNGDIGRVLRQQAFLSALTGEIGSTYNPLTLARVADTLAAGMRIDSDLGFLEALNLLRRMRSMDLAPNALPTTGFTTSAGAQVLRLAPGADEVLGQFGSPGATIS